MVLNIGLDFDGVIVNSHPIKAIVAKAKFGVEIPPEQFRREFVIPTFLSEDEYRQVGQEAMDGTHPMPLVDQVQYYIGLLVKAGHSIRVVTSRTGGMLETATTVLTENKINFPIQGVGYGFSKESACAGLDIFVDDDIDKLLPLQRKVKHLLFFSWPWNIHEKVPKGITRVSNWWEIYNYTRYEV